MKYRLSRLDVLQLALEGACMRRGIATDLKDEEWEELDRDVAELTQRVKEAQAKQDALTQPRAA